MRLLYFSTWEHSILNALTCKGYFELVGGPVMLALITAS